MNGDDRSGTGRGGALKAAAAATVLLLLGLGWGWLALQSRERDLDRAQQALQLQVLTSRIGAAAIYVEYGDYAQALSVVSRVFEGIQNQAIERGSLPENYAAVLGARDEIVAALARERPEVRERLVELFFALQIPVDTQLDPERIIPATDSGAGMTPPARRVHGEGLEPVDTLAVPGEAAPMDTVAPRGGGGPPEEGG